MGKIIVVVSGLLALLVFPAGVILHDVFHSPLADFLRFVCCPFFILVFLLSLFGVRTRRSSINPTTRKIFLGLRVGVLLGLAWFSIGVFWPRSYGSLPRPERAGIQYWQLSTGSRIAYTLIPGKGVKKPYPIIYLQGGPGGPIGGGEIRMMTPIAEAGYDIYLYDQVGCGASDYLSNIRDYTADRHKRDLEAIVKTIGAPKAILIGQSWGAILATLFAADNQQSVAALIVTGPGPIQPVHRELAPLAAPDSLHLHKPVFTNQQGNELASNIRTRAMGWMATNFGVRLASDKEADDFAAYLSRLVNRSTVFDTSLLRSRPQPKIGAGFYAGVMTVQSFRHVADPRPKLRQTTIPILVMKGQYDNQQWGFTHEYLDLFPNHQLVVIPNAGHCISCDQPEQYESIIRNFLDRSSVTR
jgi:proline iminopeptidase